MTAAELAELNIPARDVTALKMRKWPNTARGINKRAEAEGWTGRKVGSSQAWEYLTSSLPTLVQKAIATGALQLVAPASVQLPLPLQNAADLKDHQRDRMTARAILLQQVDDLVLLRGISRGQAVAALVEMAGKGALAPDIQKMVGIANARSNADRSLTRATVYNWLKARDAAAGAVVALAPKAVKEAPVPFWASTFFKLWADPRQPALTVVLNRLWPAEEEKPSYDQANRLLKKVSIITRHKGRLGNRELRKFKTYHARDTSELWPGAVFCGDGHTFKAEVAHPIHGRPFRPEITLVIDVYTRKIVGWSVDLAENTRSVAGALRHAVTSSTQCDIFYYDNGSGAKNVNWDEPTTGLAARLGITKMHSIAYNSQARGVVERRNSTVLHQAAKMMTSYVGQDMDKEARQAGFKQTRKDVKAKGVSVLLPSWRDFVSLIETEVMVANDMPCDGLPWTVDSETFKRRHMTANEMWSQAVAEGWQPDPLPEEEAVDLFRPQVKHKTMRGLIRLFNNDYFGGKLLEAYGGEWVRVSYDIHDASKVWVYNEDGRLICEAVWGGHVTSYVPVAFAELAHEKRVAGKVQRLEAHLDTARAELGPPLLEHSPTVNFSIEQLHAAENVIDLVAATRPGAPAPIAAGRPTFADDVSWARWLVKNPTEITAKDRDQLRAQMRRSEFLTLCEWEGVAKASLEDLINQQVGVA
jgi:putative transposase